LDFPGGSYISGQFFFAVKIAIYPKFEIMFQGHHPEVHQFYDNHQYFTVKATKFAGYSCAKSSNRLSGLK
jgi:hypothetical protein